MTAGFAAANGGQIYYEVAGHGPALLMVPGFTMSAAMWDDQWEIFATAFRVIRFDLRGAGRSPPPEGPYTYEADILALLDHLDVEAAHVMGLSLGGAITLDFALAHPARVASIIPADTSALGGYPWPDELSGWFKSISEAAGAGDMAEAKRRWMATEWFAPAMEQPAVAEKLRMLMNDYTGWHFTNRNPVVRPAGPAAANNRLGEITVPTMIVTGGRDTAIYNLPIAERLTQEIPGAWSLMIEEAGHMSNMEAPAIFNAGVKRFLDQVAR
jgi:3-oxoadipate enol-lactonase